MLNWKDILKPSAGKVTLAIILLLYLPLPGIQFFDCQDYKILTKCSTSFVFEPFSISRSLLETAGTLLPDFYVPDEYVSPVLWLVLPVLFITYLLAGLFTSLYKNIPDSTKNFLKPSVGKIILSIILLMLIPFPGMVGYSCALVNSCSDEFTLEPFGLFRFVAAVFGADYYDYKFYSPFFSLFIPYLCAAYLLAGIIFYLYNKFSIKISVKNN